MPIEEICKLIAQRLLQGCMNHEQFANYYDFLGLEGFKLTHECHFLEQMQGYRDFITYYVKHYNKLISNFSSETLTSSSFSIIPQNWYEYRRDDVDLNTRRNAVKSGLEKYISWQTQTKKFFQDMYTHAIQQKEVSLSLKIKHYIKSVDQEILKAEKIHLELKATDYDLPTIISKQQYLIKKYIKKQRKEFEYAKSSLDRVGYQRT